MRGLRRRVGPHDGANRTNVELKYGVNGRSKTSFSSANRTYVELKSGFAVGLTSKLGSANRTNVELKCYSGAWVIAVAVC